MSQSATALLKPPGVVMEIARTLQLAGFETWCVGGAVRDALLGRHSLDWDLATAAEPKIVRRLFRRTIPVGIEFGTVGVMDELGVMHEVTTFRRDVHTDGRHAVVEFGASLDQDLARRDLTINAIAFDPIAGLLHDPFGGQDDLRARLVRAVGDPDARFEEDRLRALRAIRFAARFDFEIEVDTWRAIVRSAPHLTRLSPERVKQELEKTLEQVVRPSVAFTRWRDSGAFAAIIPALADVSNDTLATVDALPRPTLARRPQRRALRMAALLSDTDGRSAGRALRALRSSNQEVSWISSLVDAWHHHGAEWTVRMGELAPPTDAQLRVLAAALGRLRVAPFFRLAAAKWGAARSNAGVTASRAASVYRCALRIAFRDAIEIADLAIDGDDLRSVGIPAGPIYARLLASLLQEVVNDPSRNQRDTLLNRAMDFALNENPGDPNKSDADMLKGLIDE